ncbi:condensin-2 complex subunit H2 isoform X2 [Jatropha curcas]|uniref:condensin-2 complex subunit H2 isoform X2 n=1 Tax=Jatropha curcas TaxID=180498 RepID=UPI001894F263|nr:condensin-2 complex subunit H2 isoform X2 [Jatropha curcas]
MTNNREPPPSKLHTVQAERDLEANWDVDLAKKLEDYLLKICSGEITGSEYYATNISVNFAEAALLLQGSVQVYSRKVEYLYNLVLHALEFLSQNSQQEQSEGTSVQADQIGSHSVPDEDNDHFWGLDDVPVESRNCLDASTSKDASTYHFVKPPANLVVLEGDCLDTTGDGGELESYLLATHDLYRDFILLDPSDAVAVNNFLKGDEVGKQQNSTYRGSSVRKSFQSPTMCSGGTARKSSLGNNADTNLHHPSTADCGVGVDNHTMMKDPSAYDNFGDSNHGFDMDDRYSGPGNLEDSEDDDDDPWKPLNPHEPGSLKVKPFRKVKPYRRNESNSAKQTSITTLFPLARMRGTISPELTEIWEARCNRSQIKGNSIPLYEKLRKSLNEGYSANDTFGSTGNDDEGNGHDSGIPDFEQPDDDIPENMYVDGDLPLHHEKCHDSSTHFNTNEAFGQEDPSSQASLEDLCRSHLEALLANIAESEKQTELATRVSSWKQKIEHNLAEQDSRPPFDIHGYGERILDKLSHDCDNAMSFADVVKGQAKHDVARTFSALLQLVNNGDVDLKRSGVGGDSICYTAVNPFHVRLLGHDKRWKETPFRLPKKRVKSPIRKGCNENSEKKFGRDASPRINSSPQSGSTVLKQPNCKFSAKLGKVGGGVRCTPEGKRRRRSRFVEAVDLNSTR